MPASLSSASLIRNWANERHQKPKRLIILCLYATDLQGKHFKTPYLSRHFAALLLLKANKMGKSEGSLNMECEYYFRKHVNI